MLYISTQVEYGLNILIILAKGRARMSLKQISKQGRMPYRFLTKIIKLLIKANLVQAKEGKNGGYVLTKNPKQIKVKDILQTLGEPMKITRCLCGAECASQKDCKMKKVWLKIKKNINQELDKMTLKDLL